MITGTLPGARILALIRERASDASPGPGPAAAGARVAEAVVFSDGSAVLHWLTAPSSTEFYASEDEMRKIRENRGRAHFQPVREVTS